MTLIPRSVLCLVLCILGACNSETDGCVTDRDCKGSRVCGQALRCIDPGTVTEQDLRSPVGELSDMQGAPDALLCSADLRYDPRSCGTCGRSCAGDETCCGGTCKQIELVPVNRNCLECGKACAPFGAPFPVDSVACCPLNDGSGHGSCTNIKYGSGSAKNCGACGQVCTSGVCCAGKCCEGSNMYCGEVTPGDFRCFYRR